MMWAIPFFKGMGLGASLIIAIGSQNAFVLGQAMRKNHALLIALCCAAIDAVLIFAGVLGLGALVKNSPTFLIIATFGGALFLAIYGFTALKRALKPSHLTASHHTHISTATGAIVTTLALSLLNPHVYLDTVVLLGSIGGQLPGNQPLIFALGATTASFLWFMGLAAGGKLVAPFLQEDKHWQRLDALIGLTMWAIALSLINGYFNRL